MDQSELGFFAQIISSKILPRAMDNFWFSKLDEPVTPMKFFKWLMCYLGEWKTMDSSQVLFDVFEFCILIVLVEEILCE